MRFWARIPLPAPTAQAEIDRFKTEIRAAPAGVRRAAIDAFVRQYDEVKSDLNSTRGSAGGLLAATGVITGVVALTAGFTPLFQGRSWIAVVGLALSAVVVYCAVATTFLAIRAQQVDFWGQAELHPNELFDAITYEAEYVTALYVSWLDNVQRLRNPVGYLRDAQAFFRALVIALGSLVVLTIVTALVTPPLSTAAGAANSRPTSASSSPRH
jgi:hypothetical protein